MRLLLLGIRHSPILYTKTFISNSRAQTRHRFVYQELNDPYLLRISINDFIISNKISHRKKVSLETTSLETVRYQTRVSYQAMIHLSHEILKHSDGHSEHIGHPRRPYSRQDKYSAPSCQIHRFSLAINMSYSTTGK